MIGDYRIVVPTKGRSGIIGDRAYKALPSATFLVYEKDRDEYAKVIPEDQIVTTSALGSAKAFRAAMDLFDERTIVIAGDEFFRVRCMVGQRMRVYDDPADILAIIENGIAISRDLGTDLFYWNASPNPIYARPESPFSLFGGFPGGCFGVHGREINFDTALTTREDVDLMMQAYLHSRFIWSDLRFYFDCGDTWKGGGGNQGIRTNQTEVEDAKYLQRKWGGYLELFAKGRLLKNTTGVKAKILRKNPIVSVR